MGKASNEHFSVEHVKEVLVHFKPALHRFLGGKNVHIEPMDKLPKGVKGSSNAGASICNKNIYAWIDSVDEKVFFKITRPNCNFTDMEVVFLKEFFKTVQILMSKSDPGAHKAHFKTGLIASAFEVSISRLLRDDVGEFWRIQQLLHYLKDLSFMRYEGAPCTTGFIFTNDENKALESYSRKECKFKFYGDIKKKNIRLSDSFFESVLSYRYVDGVRSIYVINNHLKIIGILELPVETAYTYIDHTTHSTFLPAIEVLNDKAFAIFVTKNSDINIVQTSGDIIRWRKGKWNQVNKGILKNIIGPYLNDSDCDLFIQVLIALSSSGHGAVLLLPGKNNEAWHNYEDEGLLARHIDGRDPSDISSALRDLRLKKHLQDLKIAGILVSMLSTDGMTVISWDGKLEESSLLVRLGGDKDGAGGGRSAAARRASEFGLAIKVSEDGPIQIYKKGKPLIEIA